MKRVCFILFLIFRWNASYCQVASYNSLEEVLEKHFRDFSSIHPKYDHVFFAIDFDSDLKLPEKFQQIKFPVNSGWLNKKDKDYFIRVTISDHDSAFKITIVDFLIKKKNKKHTDFVNVGGFVYLINSRNSK